jgi:hypothetical protein
MTVIPAENNTGSDAHFKHFRNDWAIPFGRPGAAKDYAQCILGLVSVGPHTQSMVLTRRRTHMSLVPRSSLTEDGSWSLVRRTRLTEANLLTGLAF